MVWRTIRGRRVRVRSRKREKHLYTNPAERAVVRRTFTEEYGPVKGRYVYGAVVGKVRREQAAAGTRSHREVIRAHKSHSRKGKVERVRRSVRYI